MKKFTVEGHSTESMEDALADAMAKAAAYMSEEYDVNVAIKELSVLPGRGYKAVLEVTIVPFGEKDRFHPDAQDVELKKIHLKEYWQRRRMDEKRLRQIVNNHFSMSAGNWCPDIPDFYMAQLNESWLLNFEIEKQFFRAAQFMPRIDVPSQEPDVPALKQVLGRPLPKYEPEPE